MSRRPVRLLTEDILERTGRIERHMAGIDHDTFLGDDKTIDAVARNLEVIGEAAARLPEEFRDSYPDIPWRQIVGLRNRIVHQYFDLDLELVWQIVSTELPDLKRRLVVALEKMDDL